MPDLIKNGVKDSDVKAFADQATVYINKGLGKLTLPSIPVRR